MTSWFGHRQRLVCLAVSAFALLGCRSTAIDKDKPPVPLEGQKPSSSPSLPIAPSAQTQSLPTQPSAASTAVAAKPASGPGRIVQSSFVSAALGVSKTYLAYLPSGYDGSADRYPVIYLLHGLGGDETNWVKVGDLQRNADALNLTAIIVMPDGDDSFYVNANYVSSYESCLQEKVPFNGAERPEHYCVKKPLYEDYLVKDLIGHLDSTYRTVADRKGRATIGLSMGGFGALMLAMRHKDVYSAGASHSGMVSLLYGGPHPYIKGAAGPATSLSNWGNEYSQSFRNHVIKLFGADLDHWRAYDPSLLAASLNEGDLALYFDCGTEDGFKFQDGATYLHDVLDARKVTHTFELMPGGHSFALWKVRIRSSLAFMAGHFRRMGTGP